MATTIVTKNSSSPGNQPTSGQIEKGELAVNLADKKIYTKDHTGAVVELGSDGTTDLSYTAAAGDGTVVSSTGTDATLPPVNDFEAGLMLPEQKEELENILLKKKI